MKIIGMDGLTTDLVNHELQNGARFVVFEYCISILVMTFKRGSDVYYVRPGESVIAKALPWTLLSLLLGWWGIPWGPIWTISTVFRNLSGGRDVTQELIAASHSSS